MAYCQGKQELDKPKKGYYLNGEVVDSLTFHRAKSRSINTKKDNIPKLDTFEEFPTFFLDQGL